MNTNWYSQIQKEAKIKKDPLQNFVCTVSDQELKREFKTDYGGPQGCPFYAWSDLRVYYTSEYDGIAQVHSVPRNPTNEPASFYD